SSTCGQWCFSPGRRRLFQKRETLALAVCEITLGAQPGQRSHAGNVPCALGDADRLSRIEKIKKVRSLDAVIVGGQDESLIDQPSAFGLEQAEDFGEHRDIRDFKIILGKLNFILMMDCPVRDFFIPAKVIYVVHSLEVHRNSLQSVSNLDRYGIQTDS